MKKIFCLCCQILYIRSKHKVFNKNIRQKCSPEDSPGRALQEDGDYFKIGVGQKKTDDLMEVWRQWAAGRGTWEAGVEGWDENGQVLA